MTLLTPQQGFLEVRTTLEKEIERRMGEMIKRRGGLYYKFESPGNAGVPDRIVITPDGRIIFVELKTTIGRLSNIQKWQIERMRANGADVRKIQGWDEARAFVDAVFPNGIAAEGGGAK